MKLMRPLGSLVAVIAGVVMLGSVAVLAGAGPGGGRISGKRPATPACASAEIAHVADEAAAVFDTARFAFLGSTHGGRKRHEFLICLLSRPAFHGRARDVLVEWANPVHQRLLDRFLLQLEDLPLEALEPAVFDSDRPELWARMPQSLQFFRAVREINERLDPARRIRVIGGAAPVDWSEVRGADDLAAFPFKTNWAAHVVTGHFASRSGRRLLVVYGDGHIHYGGTLMSDIQGAVEDDLLYVVGTIADRAGADASAIARLGDPSHAFFARAAGLPSQPPYPDDLFYADSRSLAEVVDAVAYLGPDPDDDLSGTLELDDAQRAELRRRDEMRGDPREAMETRLRNRGRWFSAHPDDLPERPEPNEPGSSAKLVSVATPDGGIVYADLYGEGEHAVVLVPGGRFDRSSWTKQARSLAEAGLRVLAIDPRGRGRSRPGSAPGSLEEGYHLDVLAATRFLRDSGASRVSVIGASLGGWSAARASVAAGSGEIDDLVLLAHSPIEKPELMKGRKLFVIARDDVRGEGVPRLPAIRDQYERAPGPKELLILEGSAHAQFIFRTEQGERLMEEILRFLSGP